MMGSVMNYLVDDIGRNKERLEMLKDFINDNPLKSIQEKAIDGNIYYYLMFRENKNVKQKYLGNKKKISLNNEIKLLDEYNNKVKNIKKKYSKLKKENSKLIQIQKYIDKVYYA